MLCARVRLIGQVGAGCGQWCGGGGSSASHPPVDRCSSHRNDNPRLCTPVSADLRNTGFDLLDDTTQSLITHTLDAWPSLRAKRTLRVRSSSASTPCA